MSAAAPAPKPEGRSEDPDPDPDADGHAAGDSRLWTRPFINLIVVQAIFGLSYAQFILLPKLLAVTYHATARQIGVVMAAFGVASLVVIPVMAPALRRLSCRRAMVFANLLLAGSALAFTTIESAGLAAALLRGVHGIAWSLFFAAGMSLVVDVVPTTRLAQGIGLFGAAALAMSAIGPAVAEPLAARAGANAVFVFAAVIAVVGAWFCLRLPETAPAASSSRAPAPAAPASGAGGRAVVVVVFTMGSLAAAAVSTFIAPFALAHHIDVVRGFFIAYTAAALGMRIGGARFADRLGYRRMAFAGCAGYGLMVIVLGLAGPGQLVLLGAAFGVAHGVVYPALMALVIAGVPPEQRARALALTNGAINLGVAGVGVLGPIAERVGYATVFTATGLATFASALLLVRGRDARTPA
jgi:MFS family permease